VITVVESSFGRINMLSKPIEWLTDNGSRFIARDTASLLRDIGMEPCTTPVRSPQSNGMAEAFVKPSSAITSRQTRPQCRNRATAVLVQTLR